MELPTLTVRDHYQQTQKIEQEMEKGRLVELPTLIVRDHYQQIQKMETEME